MPNRIRVLSDEVIGKIAAGEVVERPAAAVKELVENSLDAGATAVTVEIRDGGISYLRVTDNGSGIQQSDVRMAFERHATSKITAAQDLAGIHTLGFRGEALASIAAVSRVTCTTRTEADESGVRVLNEGGRITALTEAACPVGTTIIVRDLFYNTPVRLNFLKKPATEAGAVSDYMMRLILSRPDIAFRYLSQGKTVYHSPGDGKLESAVYAIYGNEMIRTMRRVKGHGGGVLLDGYVGIGESGRGNRNHQSFFVNGRYMRSGILSSAVEEACKERVMIGKYPACVIHLTMPYEQVDVNVHPNKLEVRFQDEAGLRQAVTDIVREGLQDRDALEHPVVLPLTPEQPALRPAQVTRQAVAPAVKPADVPQAVPAVKPAGPVPQVMPAGSAGAPVAAPTPRPQVPAPSPVLREKPMDLSGFRKDAPAAPQAAPAPQAEPVPQAVPAPQAPAQEEQASFLPDAPKPMRLIGQVFDTYILIEYEDHLLLMDQHAVHERLNYERMMKAYDTQQAGQELLVPMVAHVTWQEQQLLEEHRTELEELGLRVEPFGENEVAIRAIPMVLGEPQTESFLREVLAQLESERGTVTRQKRRDAILQIACKKAIKGGEKISEEDMRYLVSEMVDRKVTPTCPHGRPLVVALSHTELDKRFKRIQS